MHLGEFLLLPSLLHPELCLKLSKVLFELSNFLIVAIYSHGFISHCLFLCEVLDSDFIHNVAEVVVVVIVFHILSCAIVLYSHLLITSSGLTIRLNREESAKKVGVFLVFIDGVLV